MQKTPVAIKQPFIQRRWFATSGLQRKEDFDRVVNEFKDFLIKNPLKSEAKKKYFEIIRKVHPDVNPQFQELSHETFAEVRKLYEKFKKGAPIEIEFEESKEDRKEEPEIKKPFGDGESFADFMKKESEYWEKQFRA